MIFDEPTAMLTPQEIESLLQVIRNLRDAGKTIILITHKLEEIKQVADRCAVLCRGKLVSECDVATTSTHDMAYMMVGREVSEEMEKEPASLGKEVLRVENLTVKNATGFPVVKMFPSPFEKVKSLPWRAYPATDRKNWRTPLQEW